MTKEFVYRFIKQHTLAVISTISANNTPESALIGFAVSENLEIIFDTVNTSRKYVNILQNPKVSLVIGWDRETTLQYEGEATVLSRNEAKDLKEIYFDVFKNASERAETWPNIAHLKITPKWIRYSNFNEPTVIEEMAPPFF